MGFAESIWVLGFSYYLQFSQEISFRPKFFLRGSLFFLCGMLIRDLMYGNLSFHSV